jgi:hypothetical protein
VTAIEARLAALAPSEDTTQDVRIHHRSADPLKAEHLEVSLQHIGVHRSELVRADVEIDAHFAELLLDDRGLQPRLFGVGDLSATTEGGEAGRRRPDPCNPLRQAVAVSDSDRT